MIGQQCGLRSSPRESSTFRQPAGLESALRAITRAHALLRRTCRLPGESSRELVSFEARPLSNGLTAVRSAVSRAPLGPTILIDLVSSARGESGQRGNEQPRLKRLTGRRIRFSRAQDR